MPPIPIIGGTGALGYGLARALGERRRSTVVIGSREPARAEEAAERIRAAVPGRRRSRGSSTTTPPRRGPIVFLTVPFRAQSETLNNLREALEPGQILVDCTVPLAAAVSGKATRSLGVWQGSAAQQAQEMVPDGRHRRLRPAHGRRPDPRRPRRRRSARTSSSAATSKADKAPVARLIELIPGLRAVNAGPLEMARIVEQLTPLLISVNVRYKAHAGIRLTGLPDARPLGRERSSLLAGGTGGAKLARRHAGGDRRRADGDRQHRRRHRGARRPRLPRPRPRAPTGSAARSTRSAAGGSATTPSRSSSGCGELGAPDWFGLSDRDLATCLDRRQLPRRRRAADRRPGSRSPAALGVEATVLPMCDEPVRTRVRTRRRLARLPGVPDPSTAREPEIEEVELDGIADGRADPGGRSTALRGGRGDRDRPLEPGDHDRPDPRRARDARSDRRRRRPGRRGQPVRRRRGRQGPDRQVHARRSGTSPRPPASPRSTTG